MNIRTFSTRIVVTLLLVLFCVSSIWAEDVTTEQALELARNFITKQQTPGKPRKSQAAPKQLTLASKVSGLYVFNVEDNGGYIIVSNDDRTYPILGFSETGNFNKDEMPNNMKAWLQGYADEITWLQQQHGSVAPPKTDKVGTHSTAAVAPLVTSKWNQDAPYNNLCPTYSSWSGSGKCATGCVATAMAQVMYYHKWPAKSTKAIPGYTCTDYTLSSLPITTFDWANMKDSYSGSYTTIQGNAVAKLMQYCGYSVKMDYGPSSGAYTEDVAIALREYFDYNRNTTRFVSRSSFTYANWTDMIYHEVSHNRPVCYGGLSSGGGHEFVCDGYKFESNTDFFHINWGWGGMSDNYFVLSALDPDQQGIGGSTSTDGFHYGQDAVIGIQKSTDTGTLANIPANVVDLTVNSISLSRNPVEPYTMVNITFNITNNSTDPYDGDLWLCQRENGNDYIIELESVLLPAGSTQDVVMSYTPSEAGTYTFMLCYINANGEYITYEGQSATLTVAQSLTNEYVPIYGYWADNYSRSQFIIGEADLEEMIGGELNSMTFTASQENVNWGAAKFDVYLKSVSESTISSLKSWNTLDKVYSGSLSIVNNEMKITFNEPYFYEGGNLLVGVNQTVTGTYSKSSWYGETVTGVSVGGYGSNINQQNFLPDVTFDFTPGTGIHVIKPKNLAVNYTGGDEATVTWTSDAPAFDIDVNGTVQEDVSNPCTLTSLEYATTYYIKVRAKNGDVISDWTEPVSFTTDLSADMCQINFELSDATGDGWNGDAAIKVIDVLTGIEFGTFTCTDEVGKNEPQFYTLSVPNDRDIEFQWVRGIYDHECIYTVYDVAGNVIFSGKGRLKTPVSYHVNCSSCDAPTNVLVDEIGVTTATISWDSGLTKYDLRYKPFSEPAEGDEGDITEPEEEWFEVDNIEATSYELTELSQATTYIAQVRGYCDDAEEPTEWSNSISFTTISGNIFAIAGNWDEGTNWTGGEVPAEGTDVIIRANVIVPAGVVADAGHIALENEATITVQDGAQLKTTSDDVTVTMIKHITAYTDERDNYSLIASPMTALSDVTDLTDLTVDCDFDLYAFDSNEEKEWRNYETEEFSLNHGIGYLYANSTERDISFTGTVQPTDIPVTCDLIYQGEDFPGFALVGNPFPCNAYIAEGRPIYRLNAEGTALVPATSSVIAPMEAVFVSFDADGSITFTTMEPEEEFVEAEETLMPLLPLHNLVEHQDAKEVVFDITLTSYDENNAAIIEEYDGKLCNVTLTGRTFHRDGYWNTICLPFDLELEGSPFEGADLRTLSEASIEEDCVTLNFTEEGELNAITAGTPYIIKWEAGESLTEADLVFTRVVVRNTQNDFTGAEGKIMFRGTYSPLLFTAEDEDILFMGGNSILYYPLHGARLGALRAYFQFVEETRFDKQFILNLGEGDDPTAIQELLQKGSEEEVWYSLDGKKLAGKPSRKGIYIKGNKTITVK